MWRDRPDFPKTPAQMVNNVIKVTTPFSFPFNTTRYLLLRDGWSVTGDYCCLYKVGCSETTWGWNSPRMIPMKSSTIKMQRGWFYFQIPLKKQYTLKMDQRVTCWTILQTKLHSTMTSNGFEVTSAWTRSDAFSGLVAFLSENRQVGKSARAHLRCDLFQG